MIYISHRGNLTGKQPERENTIEYIDEALAKGYHCEIDLWFIDREFYLGHDEPQYLVEQWSFLHNERLWCHAKNYDALQALLNMDIHCFWHQEDDYTVTSKGWIWAYPNKPGNKRTIAVMPEIDDMDVTAFDGICSDYIERYKNDQTDSI